jgi:hypothetical protein
VIMTYGFWGGFSGGWGGYSGGRSFGRFGGGGRSSKWGRGGWGRGGWGRGGWGRGGWGRGGWGNGCSPKTICIEGDPIEALNESLPETLSFQITSNASENTDINAPSLIDITIGEGSLANGTPYDAWCIEPSRIIFNAEDYDSVVYSSQELLDNGLAGTAVDGILPGFENFDSINWLINQDFGDGDDPYTVGDVQLAKWALLQDIDGPIGDDAYLLDAATAYLGEAPSGDGTNLGSDPDLDYDGARVRQIIADALAEDGYTPGSGDQMAVVLAPTFNAVDGDLLDGNGVTTAQPVIIEVTVPEAEKKCYDKMTGSCWDDCLYGDEGNDFINGKGGDDYMKGGEGCDIFYFKKGESLGYHDNVVIKDFNVEEDSLMFKGYGSGISSLHDLGHVSEYSGSHYSGLKVNLTDGGNLYLRGLSAELGNQVEFVKA